MMYRRILSFLLPLTALVFTLNLSATEPIFEVNFDTYSAHADRASGDGTCRIAGNVDLKSRGIAGVGGKGNALVLSSTEYCTYSAEKNFNSAEGTVSLWVAPQNWRPSEKQYEIFFEVRLSSGMVLTLYKYVYANCFYANMTNPGIPGDTKALCASTLMTDEQWPIGSWHKLDATWDAASLKLYIDGLQQPDIRWHRHTKQFPQGTTFPGVSKNDTFVIGAGPYWSKRQVAEHKTAYDQIQIYSKALTADEIRKNFQQGVILRASTVAPAKSVKPQAPAKSADTAVPAGKLSSTTPAGQDVCFEVNFDSFTTNAAVARGNGKCLSFTNPDLQMRMFNGVNNTGNAIVLDGTEFCSYDAEKNFNAAAGTVTLWVAPQNWLPSEKKPQLFFEARLSSGMVLTIYKYFYANCFYANLVYPGIPGPKKDLCASSIMKDDQWPTGKWHRIDATWDTEALKLYIDGLQQPDVTWHRHTRALPKDTVFQPAVKGDKFTIGAGLSWRNHIDAKHRTAFDIVRIHDRPLSAEEIRQDYDRVKPSQFGKKTEANQLTIPFVERAPRIDGALTDDWLQATAVPMDLVMAGSESRVCQGNAAGYLAYDHDFLYVGATLNHRMTTGKIKTADGNLWEDDSLEFHLSKKDGNAYQFIVNAEGVIYDSRNQDKRWNSNAKTAVSNKASGWVLEMAIPLSAFDGEFKTGDDVQGGLFMAFQTKKGLASQAWNDSGNKMYIDNFATMRFGAAGDGVQMAIDAPREQGAFTVTLKAAQPKDLQVKTLLTAENGETLSHTGDPLQVPWKLTPVAGRYTLDIQVLKNGTLLHRNTSTFTVNPPITVKYTSLPSQKRVDVTVDFSNADEQLRNHVQQEGLTGRLELFRNGKVYTSVPMTVKALKSLQVLPLPEPPPAGTYAIRAVFGELSGSAEFRVPDYTPYREHVGLDDSIPAPWTALRQIGKLTFVLLDREYTFGDNPAPIRVTSRQTAVLPAAPVWMLNNQAVRWETARVDRLKATHVCLSGKGTAGDLLFTWKGELWFDGVYKLTLSMIPSKGTSTIDSWRLSYQVPTACARYVLSPTLLPWQGNAIDARYAIPQPNANRDFFIWTTGPEKGFMWWPKSDANWVNPSDEKQIHLTRKEERTEIRIDIISKRAALAKTAEYTMVFLGTPVRPLPADARYFNVDGWGKLKNSRVQTFGWGVFEHKPTREDCTSCAGLVPAYPEQFPAAIKRWTDVGQHPYLYGMPAQIATVDPEYDYFFAEWAKTPTYVHATYKNGVRIANEPCCGHTAVADLAAWRVDRLFRSYPDLEGLYFDLSDVRFCDNPHHGCGGVDAFGRAYYSSIALNMREYYMRIYKIVRKYNRKMVLHAHNLFNPIGHSFSDGWWPGEQCFLPLSQNFDHYYCEGISPEELQSEFNAEIKGVPLSLLPQYARVCAPNCGLAHLKPRFNEIVNSDEYALRTLTPMMVHDVNVSATQIKVATVGRWWDIRERLNLAQAKFHAYWLEDTLKSTTPRILASWYELTAPADGYTHLIVVANYARTPQPAGLVLDRARMKISSHASFYDLWEKDKPIQAAELTTHMIPGNHFWLIGIRQ